ncbi:MAG TPA: hypothetical protein VMB66_08420 [Candidatus Acidoferrales bacterium]|nr:hypothetical protein [Candidatus Acidoferrales bacterium]
MADLVYRSESATYPFRTHWGAIWGGVFSFFAIWSVFGMLGEAIFASSASPNVPHPVTGMSYGEGAWIIILTIIAFYVAGRVTSHLANLVDRTGRIIHGITMFGLTTIGFGLLVILGGMALSGGTGVTTGAHNPYTLNIFADLGWMGFIALFLGWLAAMWGASHGLTQIASGTGRGTTTENVRDMRDVRPAA